jgi:hydrogenase 3 maturation protease
LQDYLKNCEKLAIMGVGNTLKGDDGFGVALIENIINHYKGVCSTYYGENNNHHENQNSEVNILNEKVLLINCGVVPENFTDILKKEKPTHILLIDAAIMGKAPGTILPIDVNDISEIGFSTHSLPMSIIVKYIKHYINTEILIIGIEPKSVDFGKPMSNEIYKKNMEFTKIIIKLLDSFFKTYML